MVLLSSDHFGCAVQFYFLMCEMRVWTFEWFDSMLIEETVMRINQMLVCVCVCTCWGINVVIRQLQAISHHLLSTRSSVVLEFCPIGKSSWLTSFQRHLCLPRHCYQNHSYSHRHAQFSIFSRSRIWTSHL